MPYAKCVANGELCSVQKFTFNSTNKILVFRAKNLDSSRGFKAPKKILYFALLEEQGNSNHYR